MGPQDGPQKKISVSQQFYGLWRFMLDMSYTKISWILVISYNYRYNYSYKMVHKPH